MKREGYEKQRQAQLREHGGGVKNLNTLNRPERLKRRRFDHTPVTIKPKGWGWA